MIQSNNSDDAKFLVEPLFELGTSDILEWAFPELEGKPRPVIKDAALGLAKGGHLNYLASLHNRKLLLKVYSLFLPAATGGQLHTLKWLEDNNYWPSEDEFNNDDGAILEKIDQTCYDAAKNGHKNVLEWIRSHKYIVIEDALLGAAEGGQLDLLKWLFKVGVLERLSLEDIGEKATKSGHIHILKWLETKGLKLNNLLENKEKEKVNDVTNALKKGKLKELKKLIENGNKDEIDIMYAIESKSVKMLDWLLENGYCEDKEQIAYMVASSSDFNVVKWAVANGFPCVNECVASAASIGNLPMLQFLYENGATEDASAVAAKNGHLHIIQWLREKGMEMSPDALTNAEENGDLQMIALLEKN